MMGPATVAQSALDPAGPQAALLSHLWWLMFWVCTAVFVIVIAIIAAAVLRRKAEPTPERVLTGSVAFGVAATVAILFALLVVSFITGRAVASTVDAGAVTIAITGQQWWWNVEYVDPNAPSLRVRTANEIHIPVGRPIVFNLASHDVIHSFWVPNLHGKRDLIPGYQTSFWLQADRPGVYRGQCAEFCGHEHALMAFYVTAESDAEFKGWLAAQRRPAVEPSSDLTRRGQELFLKSTCTQCHTIRGTIAGAALGPELTHVASRGSIGAGTLSNTREHIERWVRDPQMVKPGNRMPPNAMSGDDLQALSAYLESLK
jgi:cytochrome c oxidase subunit II